MPFQLYLFSFFLMVLNVKVVYSHDGLHYREVLDYVRNDDASTGETETISQEFSRIQKNYARLHAEKYKDYKEMDTKTKQHFLKLIPNMSDKWKEQAAVKENLDYFVELMQSIKNPSVFPEFKELQDKIKVLNAKSHSDNK
ncbi:unnamed protein product [Spodoptera littoralis]|uniref:Uncharacterized protein n=1 Tax=Spodoptera littoralis TaxID=7109 RepID=A0A9P0N7X3_SPOLI|nr:unnamed protein product [Spodoptera littoralis]CAH1644690.1 unnamed protein product [Spodoptera littoralis]